MRSGSRRRRLRWLREFVLLAKPFWTSSERGLASFYLFFMIVISLGTIYLSVQLNRWYQEFYDMAGNAKSISEYYLFLLRYCWIAGIWISIARVRTYFRYRLRLQWREWMTRYYLSMWLQKQKHYFWTLTQQSTDNPDQRIAEDIQLFINLSIRLSLDVLENVVTFFSFAGILWSLSGVLAIPLGSSTLSIPGYLVWFSIAYACLANILVFKVGKKLVPLQYEQQHREADFRYSLIRIRENSESIALANGEEAEIKTAASRFSEVVKNFRQLIRKFVQVEIFEAFHDQIKAIFPFFIAGPRILSGAIKIGGLLQINNAFGKVEGAISFLVANFNDVSEWRSASKRLADLDQSLKRSSEIESKTKEKVNNEDQLKISDLSLLTPEGRQLIEKYSVEIREKEKVLFKGATGTGKSTLFRALAGIWPFFSGNLDVPNKNIRVFVSQSPYMPLGTLRHVLLYPDYENAILDEELVKYLNEFRLTHLVSKLNAEEDWHHILSTGERQRLVLIRALIKKPKWIFLDEATSALDPEMQTWVFNKIQKDLPNTTLVSIGHREELKNFHSRVEELKASVLIQN
jgi:vitamin B12/bleomycin/antimicrobial peptide transport system ATP-binding/permease protein